MSKIRLGNRTFNLPESRVHRLTIGGLLVLGGMLGFLPVLGFWMVPLGFLVLSVDLPAIRRWRRQMTVWWYRRKGEKEPVEKEPVEKGGSRGS